MHSGAFSKPQHTNPTQGQLISLWLAKDSRHTILFAALHHLLSDIKLAFRVVSRCPLFICLEKKTSVNIETLLVTQILTKCEFSM